MDGKNNCCCSCKSSNIKPKAVRRPACCCRKAEPNQCCSKNSKNSKKPEGKCCCCDEPFNPNRLPLCEFVPVANGGKLLAFVYIDPKYPEIGPFFTTIDGVDIYPNVKELKKGKGYVWSDKDIAAMMNASQPPMTAGFALPSGNPCLCSPLIPQNYSPPQPSIRPDYDTSKLNNQTGRQKSQNLPGRFPPVIQPPYWPCMYQPMECPRVQGKPCLINKGCNTAEFSDQQIIGPNGATVPYAPSSQSVDKKTSDRPKKATPATSYVAIVNDAKDVPSNDNVVSEKQKSTSIKSASFGDEPHADFKQRKQGDLIQIPASKPCPVVKKCKDTCPGKCRLRTSPTQGQKQSTGSVKEDKENYDILYQIKPLEEKPKDTGRSLQSEANSVIPASRRSTVSKIVDFEDKNKDTRRSQQSDSSSVVPASRRSTVSKIDYLEGKNTDSSHQRSHQSDRITFIPASRRSTVSKIDAFDVKNTDTRRSHQSDSSSVVPASRRSTVPKIVDFEGKNADSRRSHQSDQNSAIPASRRTRSKSDDLEGKNTETKRTSDPTSAIPASKPSPVKRCNPTCPGICRLHGSSSHTAQQSSDALLSDRNINSADSLTSDTDPIPRKWYFQGTRYPAEKVRFPKR